ncbi:ribosomal protein S18-alanine N-acetyltransferase [Sandaracinobacteroides hominis]|uniref:ribosomal protein S18-alanine N-acetyltransferase n=1 Tax=Sandaracinobacteroides hominis TaxID=2780086 RepID=UPI0022A65F8C|nr:ribosomal protein S18-alanine N-acetyltransferase [Sandaracinobacteroides hominis]
MSAQPTVQQPDTISPDWAIGNAGACAEAALLASTAFDPHFREAWTESQMAGLLAGGSSWLDLGRHNDQLIAFSLCRQVVDEVELLLCAVDPAFRRHGVGRTLVRQWAATAKGRGANRLFLEVRDGNVPALALYLSAGFGRTGRRPGYYRTEGGDNIDAITLSLAL